MQQFRKRLLYIMATASTLSVLAVAPVWAHGSEKHDNSGTDDAVATTDVSGSDSLRDQAEQLLTTKRAGAKTHSAEQRKKSCEARKAHIQKRADNYATAAQRHLGVFNNIFTKVQAFHDKKQLNVSNYETLVAAAKEKQTTAQTAVDQLKSLDVSIDCAQSDPATTVATLKTATKNARLALQEYRKSIKDVVVALKGASTATKDDSTSNTTDPNTNGGTQQ